MSDEITLPADKQATNQQCLLSCMFMDSGNAMWAKAVSAGVTSAHFTTPVERAMWNAISECMGNDGKVDPDAVAAIIAPAFPGRPIWTELMECQRSLWSSAGFSTYLQGVIDEYLISKGTAIAHEMARAVEASAFPGKTLSEYSERIVSLSASSGNAESRPWRDVCRATAREMAAMAENKGFKPSSVSWPWEIMDRAFKPLCGGQLVIVAARPSVGKSSVARPLAMSAAGHGKHVYYLSYEVSEESVCRQMAATISGVGVHDYPTCHKHERALFDKALKELEPLPITISTTDRSLPQLYARARAMKSQGRLNLIIIDHGLLIDEVQSAREAKVQAIAQMTGTLKKIAVALDVPVVLLWQINRDGDTSKTDQPPSLARLKGSGSLEEDADKAIILHRPSQNPFTGESQEARADGTTPERVYVQISQEKGRDDGTCALGFEFHRPTATFSPYRKR